MNVNSTYISFAYNLACYIKGLTPPACLKELAAASTAVGLSRSYICLAFSVTFIPRIWLQKSPYLRQILPFSLLTILLPTSSTVQQYNMKSDVVRLFCTDSLSCICSNSHITHGIISFLNQISAAPGFNASMINECFDEYFDEYSTLLSSAPYVTTTMQTSSSFAVIKTPPSDIEARCSASNLPGSLHSCLTACNPSACCYPGFDRETCFGNIGCSLYRLYCDVIYDAWINGTSRVLKEVTDETIGKCTETKTASYNRPPAVS